MEDPVLCISESARVKNYSLYTVFLNMKIHVVHCIENTNRACHIIPEKQEKPHIITHNKNTSKHTLSTRRKTWEHTWLHTTKTGEKQKEKKERRRINVSTR